MKPSEKCKQAGLKSLAELSGITGESVQTLNNWSKNKPNIFDAALMWAVKKRKCIMMSITLKNRDGEELLKEEISVSIDDDHERFEEKAKELNAAILWNRYSDGCLGYWTPEGASFEPHYYVK